MGYPFVLCTLFLRIKHDTEVDHNELKEKKKSTKRASVSPPLNSSSLADLLTCLGSERTAARVNIQMFIPHVANTAVVKCLCSSFSLQLIQRRDSRGRGGRG